MEPAERTIVDGLVMGDTVAQQVKLSHRIMHISTHATTRNSRERLTEAR